MKANFDYNTQQWVLETPIALNGVQLTRVVNYLRKQYEQRLKGELGDRKKRMQEAVSKLSVTNLKQQLVGKEQLIYVDPTIPLKGI